MEQNNFNKYYFTKNVVEPDALRDLIMITVDKALWRKINNTGGGIIIRPCKTVDENPSQNNITVITPEPLISTEYDQLATAVMNYSESHEIAKRYGIEINLMNDTATFGQTIIEKIAAKNIFMGRHLETTSDGSMTKTRALLERNTGMIIALMTGSLTEAYQYIKEYTPDEIITLAEKEEYLKRLELKLGI